MLETVVVIWVIILVLVVGTLFAGVQAAPTPCSPPMAPAQGPWASSS